LILPLRLRCQHLKTAKNIDGKHGESGTNAKRIEIFSNEGGGGRMILNEHDFRSPAAQRLDANRAGSREEVREPRAGNIRANTLNKVRASDRS